MNKIAILMTCHNRKVETINCLQHLFQQADFGVRYSLDVFLVDDGSTDGTGLAVKQQFPQVQIIQGNGQLYWNRGMYTAWENASKQKFDAYVWLNDDTFLYWNALNELLNAMEETNNAAIICGMIESPTSKGEITYGGGNYINRQYRMNDVHGKIEKCEVINGNCVLVPHTVFIKVGNLDRLYIHAMGDNDYSLRAKQLSIDSYTTGNFIGACSPGKLPPKWCLPEVPYFKRLKNLYSPLGNSQPYYYFRFELRHFGVLVAVKHYLSIHLRATFPKLWK